MQKRFYAFLFAFLTAAVCRAPVRAEDRSLVILFGPTTVEHAQQAAPAAAAAAHNWLKLPGATAELRRAGVADSQVLTRFMPPKDIELVFLDAAKSSRGIDLDSFLNALDKASYASGHHPGQRVLVLIQDSPPASDELNNRLLQTIEFCRSNAVHVMVIDASAANAKEGSDSWEKLASSTGGTWTGDPKALDANLLIVAPLEKAGTGAATPVAAAPSSPIHAHFVNMREQWTGAGIVSDIGPAHGWMIVEAPFSLLQFDQNDRAGTYQARARITSTVKNADGKVAWEAKKEVTIKGPLRRLPERHAGNLYFLRELQLPGGQYTANALVEDLVSNKSWTYSEPLKRRENLPGFSVSGAMFVRTLKDSADRFEADQVLSYEGRALAPLLDPVFHADVPFEMGLYFIVYPDVRGAQPEMSLEILRNGQVVQRTQLLFKDKIHDTAQDSQDIGTGAMAKMGGEKSQFPYLARISDAVFSAGEYEARLTVRQGRQTITRSEPFRVVP